MIFFKFSLSQKILAIGRKRRRYYIHLHSVVYVINRFFVSFTKKSVASLPSPPPPPPYKYISLALCCCCLARRLLFLFKVFSRPACAAACRALCRVIMYHIKKSRYIYYESSLSLLTRGVRVDLTTRVQTSKNLKVSAEKEKRIGIHQKPQVSHQPPTLSDYVASCCCCCCTAQAKRTIKKDRKRDFSSSYSSFSIKGLC